MTENIYPIKDIMESRSDKESLLGQRGITIWFTGLSGSGKSTVAIALESLLSSKGFLCRILDGDNIRAGLNSNLGFSEADRNENIRRIAEVCKLFTETGIITIAAFVSPTNDLRRMARDIVGEEDFVEVYMSTPLAECERRDVKGLYARARRGEVKNFTGISAPFDIPEHPTLSIDTTDSRPEECAQLIFNQIAERISLPSKESGYEENYI
ncbi:MAG: adenylyl-sulfate kinase [Candidatus Cryptobacteroides sp.]